MGQWPFVLRCHTCGLVTIPVFWSKLSIFNELSLALHRKTGHLMKFIKLPILYLSSCLHCSEIVFQAGMWYELHEEHRWKCGGDTANHFKDMRIVAI